MFVWRRSAPEARQAIAALGSRALALPSFSQAGSRATRDAVIPSCAFCSSATTRPMLGSGRPRSSSSFRKSSARSATPPICCCRTGLAHTRGPFTCGRRSARLPRGRPSGVRSRSAGPYDVVDVASAEGLWLASVGRHAVNGASVISRSNGLEHLNYRRMLDDADAGLLTKPWTRRWFHPAVRLTQVAATARAADRLLVLNDGDRAFAIAHHWKPEQPDRRRSARRLASLFRATAAVFVAARPRHSLLRDLDARERRELSGGRLHPARRRRVPSESHYSRRRCGARRHSIGLSITGHSLF